MAGFFSPSLNFATGIGAFIGGAAHAGSDMLAHDRAQDEQLDKIRIAKFADGVKQYEDEQKSYKKEKSAYDYVLAATGSKRAADAAVNRYRSDPKINLEEFITNARNENPNLTSLDQGYNSPFEQSGVSGLQRKYNTLQQMHGSFTNPKVKSMFTLPDNPGQQDRPTNGYSSYNPYSVPPDASANPSTTVAQNGQAPGQDFGSPSAPGQPTPLAPAIAPQGNSPVVLNLGSSKFSPLQKEILDRADTYTDRDSLKRALLAARMSPQQVEAVTAGKMTGEEKQKNLVDQYRAQHTKRPEDLARESEVRINEDDAKKYLHDPKNGLQFRYNELRQMQAQNYDMTSMLQLLERGFKANAVQPMYDEFNRFTTAVLGVDLASLGVSNQVSDVQLLKKNIANGIINRLSGLHFGRITNKEVDFVNKGFASSSNDPNTNMKIVLSVQSALRSAMKQTQNEYDSVYSNPQGTMFDRIQKGRDTANGLQKEYLAKDAAPWMQIDGRQVANPDELKAMMPTNSWVEDVSTGMMFIKTPDGRIKRAGDVL